MKHPISEFWNIANSKIYKTVGEIQHDLKCQLELTTEELQQLPGIPVLDDDDNEIDQLVNKKEILGENQT